MYVQMTREEKTRVIELARELGVSATALYRELQTELPTAVNATVRADMESETIYAIKREYRTVTKAVTERCKAELVAARNRKEYKLSARVLRALSDRGLMVASGVGRTVTISAVVDRRGTLEVVGTVEVVRAGIVKLRLTASDPVQMTEAELVAALFDVLPERIDTTPARYAHTGPKAKDVRRVSDKTADSAMKGADIAPISKQGQSGVDDAHKREMARQRVARHRAKLRAAKLEAEGQTRSADVAIVAPKPVLSTDTAPRYTVPKPVPGKTIDEMNREAEKARAAREAAKLEAEAAKVAALPPVADGEPLTLF